MISLSQKVSLIVAAGLMLSIGVGVGTFGFSRSAQAGPSSFVQTGTLDMPGPSGPVSRFEDKETGIVCYLFARSQVTLGCAKK